MAETRTIRTVLELNAQRFNRGAAAAAASAKALSGELAAIGDANGKARANYDAVANSLLGVGTAAAAGLGLASKASMDWESAWAGVLKTVDGTDAQLAAVEDGLRGLTKELPASHTEIAAVAEAAGQLGVETDSVVEFTRTMINLGETTNLSAEEAATGLARFSNIMGTSQDDVDRLGAALVGLGNNFETTEGEILAMSMRLAGIGSQLGMSEGEVLGLATAMSSVGIEAEAGGTAMTLGMKKIDKAVREGGDSLAGFAEVAGMSNEEFSKLWSEDSTAGLEAFVHGLARVGEEGGSVSGTLDELGMKGIRESDTFLRLAANADGMSEALAQGNTEFERNIALVEEAAKRYETTESQLKIARNALVDAGIDIGASVLPVLADVAGGVADLAEWFSALPEPVQRSVTGLGALVGATGLVTGGMMKLVPSAMETVAAFRDLRTTSPRVASGLGKVGKAAGIAGAAFVGLQIAGGIADEFREAATTSEEMAAGLLNVSSQGNLSKEALDELFTATGTGNAEVRDLAHAIEILDANALEKAGDFLASGLGVWDTQTEVAKQQIGELDRALASLYQSGNAELVAEVLLESGVAVEDLIEKFPTLRTELTTTATAMGLEADAATLAKIATGELSPVVDETTGAVTGYRQGTEDATGAVEDQVDALQELEDQLIDVQNQLLGQRGSARDFEAAIDDATAAVEENGKTLDITTEAGRENEAALDAIADAAHRWVESLPDDASAEQIDDVMGRGRDAFLEAAEAMGIGKDEAEELADQMGLMPDFVETEVRVETEQAQKELELFWEEQGYHPPEVPVGADTEPAEGDVVLFQDGVVSSDPALAPVGADTVQASNDVATLVDEIEQSGGSVALSADPTEGYMQVDSFVAAVEQSGGTVTINGDTYEAGEALMTVLGLIDSSDGTVTINGETYPADQALEAAIAFINASGGTVTIEGDNSGAKSETDEAKRHADGTKGTIDVDADTSDAESSANHAARDRDSTIDVDAETWGANAAINAAARSRTAYINVVATGATNLIRSGLANLGRAEGGWLNEGLNAGGWVPGPYPGPGIDNVLWPVRSGLADGGMQMQPLAGTEFVVNGASAQQWGPALEAINSGMTPSDFASAMSTQTLTAAVDSGQIARDVRAAVESAHLVAQVSDRVAANLYQRGASASRAYGGGR